MDDVNNGGSHSVLKSESVASCSIMAAPAEPNAAEGDMNMEKRQDEDTAMDETGEGCNGEETGDGDKKKRHRRKFAELERIFTCPYRDCGRPYASDHSLQQHIRIKVLPKQGLRVVAHPSLHHVNSQS